MRTLQAELREEMNSHGSVGESILVQYGRQTIYEKPYSAKKPKYCNVPVECCLDCTEADCTFDAIQKVNKR